MVSVFIGELRTNDALDTENYQVKQGQTRGIIYLVVG